MSQSEKPDFRLVYDGEGGLRMAPANTVDREPEPHIVWNPDGEARLETHLDPPLAPPAPPDRRPMIIAGILLLGLVGAGLGLALRLPKPPAISHPAPSPAGQMQVEVKPDAPPRLAMARTPDRLEVLSPETREKAQAIAADTAPASNAAAPLPVRPPAPPARYAVIPAPAAPVIRPQPQAPLVSAPQPDAPPARQALRGPDCAWARSRAEVMVCNDPDLAAADRRMARAYRGAARSGAPLQQLRAEQDDWLDLREDAARVSRRAVAQLYAQRIDELEALADPQ